MSFKTILEGSRDRLASVYPRGRKTPHIYVGVHAVKGAHTVPKRSIVAYGNACYVLADGANRHECKYKEILETNRGEFTNYATRVVPEVNSLPRSFH